MSHEYERVRRVTYGDDGPTFVPVCERCGRFVRADREIVVNEIMGNVVEPNATCARCGRTYMLFEGYV